MKWITICCIISFILLNEYIWIYLLDSKNPNEFVNIFKKRKKSQMNVGISSLWKNPWVFGRMNIFVIKYLNIFEYPNIRYTLVEDVCPLPGAGQNHHLPFILPPHLGEVAKAFTLAWLLLSAKSSADKHIATLQPNVVLVRCWKKTWKPSYRHHRTEPSPSLLCFVPSSNSMNFITNLTLTPAGQVDSKWSTLFMCSLKMILVLKVM